jgi:hypothetical protein
MQTDCDSKGESSHARNRYIRRKTNLRLEKQIIRDTARQRPVHDDREQNL